MNNRLLNLYVGNKNRGSFQAAANTIELYDMIVSSDIEAEWYGGVSLQAFKRALAGMSGTVHLRINSPGGDVFAGIAMAQLIREYDGDVIAHVDGYAASAASIVAIAGSKTIMAPGAMMMIHNAWTIAIGNADDLLQSAAILEKIDGQLAEMYAVKASGKAETFADMMAKETWFTGQEAIDAGLADEIAAEKPAPAAAKAWDMSAFDRAPKKPDAAALPDPAIAAVAAQAAADEAAAKIRAEEIEHHRRVRNARLLLHTAA